MSAIADATTGKVQKYLTEGLGSVSIDRDGDFRIPYGSTECFVSIRDGFGDHTIVEAWAIVLSEVRPTAELYHHVAENDFTIGNLSVYDADDGTVRLIFSLRLLGDFLDPEELLLAVAMVARTADDLDDELQARFGGRKFTDE